MASRIERKLKGRKRLRKNSPENILAFASVQAGIKRDSVKSAETILYMKKPKKGLLGASARVEWDRVAPILKARGMFMPEYLPTIIAFCNAVGMMKDCSAKLEREGVNKYVQKGKDVSTPYQSPWVSLYNKAEEKMKTYSAMFGFSPNDALRMKAITPESGKPKPSNRFDALDSQ